MFISPHASSSCLPLTSSPSCLPLTSSPSCHICISPFIIQLSTSHFITQLSCLYLPIHPPAVYLSLHPPAGLPSSPYILQLSFLTPHSSSSCLPLTSLPSCHIYIASFFLQLSTSRSITQLSYLYLPVHHPAVIFISLHSSPSCHIYISPFITQLSYLYLPIHHPAVYFSFHHPAVYLSLQPVDLRLPYFLQLFYLPPPSSSSCLKLPLTSFSRGAVLPTGSGMSLTAPEAIFIFVVGTTLGMSVICNILVVVVVAVTPMLRNPTNVLLCNLAVSDMLLASVVLPQNLHDISHSDNYFEGG